MSEPEKIPILVLVSGGGTNLQALLDAEAAGRLEPAYIKAVLSDKQGAYALERAAAAGKTSLVESMDRTLPPDERRNDLSDRILKQARACGARLVVCAGFLSILQGQLIDAFSGRMINIHPSLLPKFGGKGMYGQKVHEAVLAAGETESGCTVHLVDAGTDTGSILLQKKVPVLSGDRAETLAARILEQEHKAIVEATIMMAKSIQGSTI